MSVNSKARRNSKSLTIELLSVLELANVSDTDSVAVLDSAAVTDSSVVDGDTLNDLDTSGSLGLLSLLGGRSGRTLLKVLGELNLLSVLLLLSGNSLALVVLELLLLLLGQLSIILGDELVKTLGGLISGALVLALGGSNKLGGLFLVVLELLNAGLIGGEIVLVIILVVLVILIIVHDVVSGEVDGVSTGNNEEDLLAMVDSDVERLLVVLESNVKSADDKVLEITALLAVIIRVLLVILLIIINLGGLGLTLGLGLAVGLGVLHLLVGLLLGSRLEKLLDSSSLSLLLGLDRVARATVGLLIGVLLVIRTSKQSLHVLLIDLVLLVVLLEAGEGTLDKAKGGSSDSRHVTLIIGLSLFCRVHGSHGDAELFEFTVRTLYSSLDSTVAIDALAATSELAQYNASHRICSAFEARGMNLQKQGTPWRQESRSLQEGPRGRKRDQEQQTL
ncbi:hypothetical protein HG530_005099 [Fusarium avenaceum]|nr:hypothetical protein HG530_005099 [Fusarium avenaceum]